MSPWQEAQIREYLQSGRPNEAQRLILGELEAQLGQVERMSMATTATPEQHARAKALLSALAPDQQYFGFSRQLAETPGLSPEQWTGVMLLHGHERGVRIEGSAARLVWSGKP